MRDATKGPRDGPAGGCRSWAARGDGALQETGACGLHEASVREGCWKDSYVGAYVELGELLGLRHVATATCFGPDECLATRPGLGLFLWA